MKRTETAPSSARTNETNKKSVKSEDQKSKKSDEQKGKTATKKPDAVDKSNQNLLSINLNIQFFI